MIKDKHYSVENDFNWNWKTALEYVRKLIHSNRFKCTLTTTKKADERSV